MTDRDRLVELITQKQNWGQTYEKSIYTRNVSNSELADHLLANGVIVLPCKVGDVVYQVGTDQNIYQSTITSVIYDTKGIAFDERAIGKTVFLTKEDAEEKLKECEKE